MELYVDDREHAVTIHFEQVNILIRRITVGDYVFEYNGVVIMVVERKTLADFSSSMKDGRIQNHDKLMECRRDTKCKILYIIEGVPYPGLVRNFGHIPYKDIQAELDKMMFVDGVDIIWTKDNKHTATRIEGLYNTFVSIAESGTFGDIKLPSVVIGGESIGPSHHVTKKHTVTLNHVHIAMLSTMRGISTYTARAALQHYTIRQLLTADIDENTLYNMTYPSGYCASSKGTRLFNMCKRIHSNKQIQVKILSCIQGITKDTAVLILDNIDFNDIVSLTFKDASISVLKKNEKRTVGKAIEKRIKMVFDVSEL